MGTFLVKIMLHFDVAFFHYFLCWMGYLYINLSTKTSKKRKFRWKLLPFRKLLNVENNGGGEKRDSAIDIITRNTAIKMLTL